MLKISTPERVAYSAEDVAISPWAHAFREEIASLFAGADAIQIGLVDASKERRKPLAPELAPLDLSAASMPDSWRELVGAAPRAVVVDLLSLRNTGTEVANALTAARQANPGGTLVLVVASGQLSARSSTPWKSVLVDGGFSLDWIVWWEESIWSLAVISVRAQSSDNTFVRLVDGRRVHFEEIANLVDSCRARRGGHSGREGVRRTSISPDRPWTWWEFSPEAEAERQDALAFGSARLLAELGELRRRPAGRSTMSELENSSLAPDHVGVVQGAQVGRDGSLAAPVHQMPLAQIGANALLVEGDCVIAAISRDVLRVAIVPPGYPPSIPHASVITLHFHESVRSVERTVIAAYLRSGWFARSIAATTPRLAGAMQVSTQALAEAVVPSFSEAFLDAWQRGQGAREQLLAWADELDGSGFFDAPSLRSELPAFLERCRTADDRIAAANDVGTLEGRIRQRFPHPLALRYENIGQMEHGSERIRKTLECAEHLVLFLAFLGVVNLGGGRSRSLETWAEGRGGLSLDWGKADLLLREAARHASRVSDPLSIAVPELAELHVALNKDDGSILNEACNELRLWRNDDSHLARCTPNEVLEKSELFAEYLRVLFEASAMLTQTPLLEVEDYKRDELDEEPLARFAYLVGVSAAFKRRWESVESELTRGHLVIRDVHGKLHSLFPWLIRRTCDKCQHTETFVLSKFDQEQAKYVAMESGHSLVEPALAKVLHRLVTREHNA